MGKFVLGVLLGVASFAFAATAGGSVNPLCSMIQALANNWGIITWLVVGILGVMVLAVGIINLTAGKAANALVVVVGGAVILVATHRLMSAAEGELSKFANSCQGAQIEFVIPVAKSE
uniref:TrbC/VirB2 family protein n=1 Tax=Thermocrinis ruber TaxID=75906 RepID=A0A7C5SX54_9AQUI